MKEAYPEIHQALIGHPAVVHTYKEEWGAHRYHVEGKLIGMLGTENEGRPILTLRCDPQKSEILRAENPHILSGYYMDKRTYISVLLEEETEQQLIMELIDHAYGQAFRMLPKYKQRAIQEEKA
ncbi:MmcQ/YjbR family DNA-binding protein [Listeria ilorinensis]|uniref:MmcQ/YjbR family DNA-binding protein n=1 Tax=Listeria ilorinensis TaxID=2867439 RepID=UPI001EF5EC2E|nr:MmcQ/YjbR family DNA-binding protein [Listeria ilorinensis]